MFKLVLCTLAVAYVSAAPVSADNIRVDKATVLPSSFVISGTHNASISGTYAQIAYVCAGLPVYQKGGSDGLVLYQQDGYKYWHVGSAAQATNASGPPGTTNCGYMDPIYLTSEGFCAASPAGAGCATQWSEYPAGNGHPDPKDCIIDPDQCINPAVKFVAAAAKEAAAAAAAATQKAAKETFVSTVHRAHQEAAKEARDEATTAAAKKAAAQTLPANIPSAVTASVVQPSLDLKPDNSSPTEYNCTMPTQGLKCVMGQAYSKTGQPWSQMITSLTLTACMNWCNGPDINVQPGPACCSWSHFDNSCYLFTNSSAAFFGPDWLFSSTCKIVPSPPPPPPPPTYKCVHGKCKASGTGGVSKDVCEEICVQHNGWILRQDHK